MRSNPASEWERNVSQFYCDMCHLPSFKFEVNWCRRRVTCRIVNLSLNHVRDCVSRWAAGDAPAMFSFDATPQTKFLTLLFIRIEVVHIKLRVVKLRGKNRPIVDKIWMLTRNLWSVHCSVLKYNKISDAFGYGPVFQLGAYSRSRCIFWLRKIWVRSVVSRVLAGTMFLIQLAGLLAGTASHVLAGWALVIGAAIRSDLGGSRRRTLNITFSLINTSEATHVRATRTQIALFGADVLCRMP